MIISLSINAIKSEVLAQTALRSHLRDYYPPMLEDEHADKLPNLARGIFAQVCLSIAPALRNCNVGEESDILQLELDDNLPCNAIALRLLIEHAISSKMLAEIYAGTDNEASAVFEQDYTAGMRCLRQSIQIPYSPSIQIIPHAM